MARRLARFRSRFRVAGPVAQLSWEQQEALAALARTLEAEHRVARQSPTIAANAVISPFASLRFVERVEIGERATIGPFCTVWGGWEHAWARVGAGALLSPGVVLVAGNHRIHGRDPIRDLGFEERDVEIGRGAWIGAHAVVVGRRVGTGAVVGANSVVTEDVPDYAIAVGVPARVVGERPPVEDGA